MTLDLLLANIEEDVKDYYINENGLPFDDVHDWFHMKRVYGACEKMLALEPKANRGEVLISALLHDVGHSKGGEIETHAEASFEIGRNILSSYTDDFEANDIDLEKVLLMVKYHTIAHICPDKNIAGTLEFSIFTDGDKIDMFGPAGVLRLTTGSAHIRKQSVYWVIDRLETMSKESNFVFQSEAGRTVGQKYKDYLGKYILELKAQRQEFE